MLDEMNVTNKNESHNVIEKGKGSLGAFIKIGLMLFIVSLRMITHIFDFVRHIFKGKKMKGGDI